MPIGNAPDPSRRMWKDFLFSVRRARDHWRRAFTATDSAEQPSPGQVQVLRWVFHKDYDCVTCELTLAGDESFELCTIPPYPTPKDAVRHFSRIDEALQRQSELEAALINDGWTLELHESTLGGPGFVAATHHE